MSATDDRSWTWLFSAWAVALLATLGALFIGEVMGQGPCVLCWYQRIAMFPLVITLGVGAFISDQKVILHSAPLAVAGFGLAAFHSLLFYGIVPEAIQPCTATGPSCSGEAMTLFGSAPLPLLSLSAFAAILLCLFLASRRHPS